MSKRKITRVDFVPKIQQLRKAGATKRRKLNNGELPQYYVSQGHPPIIAPATWDAAQQITHLALGRMSKRRPMSGEVICGECGGTHGPLLRHSTTYRNCVWECFEKKFRKSQCHCSHIYNDECNHQPRSLCNVYMKK